MGMKAEAMKHIVRHQAEDTFYIVDLGNVARMFKVMHWPMANQPTHPHTVHATNRGGGGAVRPALANVCRAGC